MKEVSIYTDGSCLGNPGRGGYGAILRYGKHEKELSGGFACTTNNRMEIYAAIAALSILREPCSVTLYSDSKYLVQAMENGWLASWRRNGWKKADKSAVLNVDLWQKLVQVMEMHKIKFQWVKGHASNPQNNRCDELARTAAAQDGLPPDEVFEASKQD